MKKALRWFLLCCLAVAALVAAAGWAAWQWVERPLDMRADKIEYIVEPGSSPAAIARTLSAAGVAVNERAFAWLARLKGQDRLIKAGAYEAARGDNMASLLERMARGQTSQRQITFVEGWTWKQIRAVLAGHADIRQTLQGVADEEILRALGADAPSLEGLFFPDTYVFTPGTSDLEILRQAYQAQQRELAKAWASRSPQLPLSTPYEALILASIIEKETGHGPERARIGGVFANRLRIGMPLQTDPTVIYGMGDAYQGRIGKRDLQTDTPWNTYTRVGLPPTPIAAPGREALMAAVQPESHGYLYFVSRGDGTSQFAQTLAEHNRNVGRYILGRKQ
jgi:conserved hypothetical protein, YceG family